MKITHRTSAEKIFERKFVCFVVCFVVVFLVLIFFGGQGVGVGFVFCFFLGGGLEYNATRR